MIAESRNHRIREQELGTIRPGNKRTREYQRTCEPSKQGSIKTDNDKENHSNYMVIMYEELVKCGFLEQSPSSTSLFSKLDASNVARLFDT